MKYPSSLPAQPKIRSVALGAPSGSWICRRGRAIYANVGAAQKSAMRLIASADGEPEASTGPERKFTWILAAHYWRSPKGAGVPPVSPSTAPKCRNVTVLYRPDANR